MQDKFPIYVTETRIFSNSSLALTLENNSKIGEKKDGKIIYSNFESLYLLEKEKSYLIDIKDKKIQEQELIKKFQKKDKEFLTKYIVYKYLKNKGYIVKTGIKFGEEFRVYIKQKKDHAKWIVFPIKSNYKLSPKELISKSRITHSTGKKLLLAIVDSEEDLTFYEIDWIKP